MAEHGGPSTEQQITFRRATLADKAALFAFIRKAWPQDWPYRIPDRWRWLYEANPFNHKRELPIWIAVSEDGQIVAQTNAMIEPIRVCGKDRLIGWGCSAYTLPAYRRRGIGTALEKLNADAQDVAARLGMPDQMRSNMSKLGAVPIDSVRRYVHEICYDHRHVNAAITRRLVRGGSKHWYDAISKLLRLTALDRAVAATLNLGVARRLAKVQHFVDRALTLREIDRFGAETDLLWHRIGPSYEVIVRRDASFCNWKYVDQPHMHYRRWFAWRGDEPQGYVVLRHALVGSWRIGIVADLFAAPDDEPTIRTLLAFAIGHFKRQGVHKLSAATTIATIGRCLHLAGFEKTDEESPMFHTKPGSEAALEPGVWFLGKSDCDWDQFPLCGPPNAQTNCVERR